MVMKTTRPTDVIAVAAAIDPDVTTAGTVTSGWVSMADFGVVMAIVMAGTLGTNATIDAKIEQATSAAGAGAKDITGKAITQITEAGTDQSDTQAIIEVAGEDLDVDGGFAFVRLSITVGTATSDVGGLVMGMDARYKPASDYDSAAVGEIVGLDA